MVEGEGGGRLKTLLFRAKEGPLADALQPRGGAPLHLAGLFARRKLAGTYFGKFFHYRRRARLTRAAGHRSRAPASVPFV